MNISKKYPQTFKKQHNHRTCSLPRPVYTNLYYTAAENSLQLAIYATQPLLLPHRFISYFRKMIRKFCKKRAIQCWFRIQPNKVVTSKAKNSRMGKGVGTINRVGFYCTPKAPIFILANVSKARARKLASMLACRLPIPLTVKKL